MWVIKTILAYGFFDVRFPRSFWFGHTECRKFIVSATEFTIAACVNVRGGKMGRRSGTVGGSVYENIGAIGA
jgi:hypothetical protein